MYYYVRCNNNHDFEFYSFSSKKDFLESFNDIEDVKFNSFESAVDAIPDLADWAEVSTSLYYIASLFNYRLNEAVHNYHKGDDDDAEIVGYRVLDFLNQKKAFLDYYCDNDKKRRAKLSAMINFDPAYENNF